MSTIRKNKTISQTKKKRKIINSYGFDVTHFGVLDISRSISNHNISKKSASKNR